VINAMKAKETKTEEIPGMPRKNPFSVPDNYFEELPSRIQERISAVPSPAVQVFSPARRILALAAMFIGLLTVGYFGFRVLMNGPDVNKLSGEEVFNAIEYYGQEFDDEMLISAVLESDIDLEPYISDNETDVIIEYLASEEIDLDELIDE
jgi:hypothetical protein